MAAATSADTAPCSSITRVGTPRLASFTSSAYATTEPTKTSLAPGMAVSRAATIPPVHDSAVASFRPRARQRSRTISATDLSSSPKRYVRELRPERFGNVRAARLSALIDEDVDVDLEVAGADGHLHSIAFTARRGERLCDG